MKSRRSAAVDTAGNRRDGAENPYPMGEATHRERSTERERRWHCIGLSDDGEHKRVNPKRWWPGEKMI